MYMAEILSFLNLGGETNFFLKIFDHLNSWKFLVSQHLLTVANNVAVYFEEKKTRNMKLI